MSSFSYILPDTFRADTRKYTRVFPPEIASPTDATRPHSFLHSAFITYRSTLEMVPECSYPSGSEIPRDSDGHPGLRLVGEADYLLCASLVPVMLMANPDE